MLRLVATISLVAIFVFFIPTESLECGIYLSPGNSSNSEFLAITERCVATLNGSGIRYGLTAASRESDEDGASGRLAGKWWGHIPDAIFCDIWDAGPRRGFGRRFLWKRGADSTGINVNEESSGSNITRSVENATEGTKEVAENCVVQCVFEKLQMTNEKGFPEYSKILNGLLKGATGRELRDFLEESTNECFQQMERSTDASDPCNYSNILVTCLAEKGRQNCADWPVDSLAFEEKKD
nr:odorant-binding protein [Lasioderma serricorne]